MFEGLLNGTGAAVRAEMIAELTKLSGGQLDLAYYRTHNMRMISIFEVRTPAEGPLFSLENTSWTNVGIDNGATPVSASYKKTGKVASMLQVTNINSGIRVNFLGTKDMGKFEDGAAISDNDYLCLVIYMAAAEIAKLDATGIRVRFITEATGTVTNYFTYNVLKANLADGWNFVKIRRGDFTLVGAPVWTALRGMDISMPVAPSSQATFYVDMACFIRKHPSLAVPFLFQREVAGVFSPEATVVSGEWYIFNEAGGIVCRNLAPAAGSPHNCLRTLQTLDYFYATGCFSPYGAADSAYELTWYVNDTNMIRAYIDAGTLYLQEVSSGVTTQVSQAVTLAAGSTVQMSLAKDGLVATVQLIIYANGVKSTMSLVKALTVTGLGVISLGAAAGKETSVTGVVYGKALPAAGSALTVGGFNPAGSKGFLSRFDRIALDALIGGVTLALAGDSGANFWTITGGGSLTATSPQGLIIATTSSAGNTTKALRKAMGSSLGLGRGAILRFGIGFSTSLVNLTGYVVVGDIADYYFGLKIVGTEAFLVYGYAGVDYAQVTTGLNTLNQGTYGYNFTVILDRDANQLIVLMGPGTGYKAVVIDIGNMPTLITENQLCLQAANGASAASRAFGVNNVLLLNAANAMDVLLSLV